MTKMEDNQNSDKIGRRSRWKTKKFSNTTKFTFPPPKKNEINQHKSELITKVVKPCVNVPKDQQLVKVSQLS